jgi:hypothetical protein
MGLDWIQDSYPLSQDNIDPTFSQLNFDNPDMFSFQDHTSTEGIISLLNYDSNSTGKNNPVRSPLKDTPHLSMDADDANQSPLPFGSNPWSLQDPNINRDSIGECIKKLSMLSSDLFEHSQTIPPLSIHDPDSVNQVKSLHPGVDDYSQYVVEETFRLTQTLIDIYPNFLSIFLNRTSTSTPSFGCTTDTSPGSSTSSTTPEDTTPTCPSKTSRSKPLDHSSIILLSSCHMRVIDIYDELFKHMGVCIRQRGVALTRRQAQLKAPTLAIGSYIPPLSSAVPMQMLLLVQFASQLSSYASDLVLELEGEFSVGTAPHEKTTMALTRAAAANVKERACSMAQELSRMRGALLNAGILA